MTRPVEADSEKLAALVATCEEINRTILGKSTPARRGPDGRPVRHLTRVEAFEVIDRARLEDRRDYDIAEHALRAMLAEHGAGHVILSLKSVARRHRRGHDPELDAAAAELLECLELEVDELDDEAPGR